MPVGFCSHLNVWLKASCRGYFSPCCDLIPGKKQLEGGRAYSHCLKSMSHDGENRKHGLRHGQQLVTPHLLSESGEQVGSQTELYNFKACPQWLTSSGKIPPPNDPAVSKSSAHDKQPNVQIHGPAAVSSHPSTAVSLRKIP